MCLGFLCLLIGAYLRLLHSHKDWEIGALSFVVIIFQVGSRQVFQKPIPECKTGKKLGDDLHLKEAERV